MYVYNDTENFLIGMRAEKFGSWYTQVWCLIVVMWVDVKRMKIKQEYLLECGRTSEMPVP